MSVKKPMKKAPAKKLTPKQEKFVEGVLRHGNGTKAAEDAGYSKKTARFIASQNLTKLNVRERIAARMAEARVETDEVLGTLASQMRGDLADILPDDEILARAKENGVSHLIKKIKRTRRLIPQKDGEPIEVITHEFEVYSAQEAAKQLCAVKGLNKEAAKNPQTAAKDALRAILSETGLSEEKARKIVASRFGIDEQQLVSDSVN